jgi:hypothetical protein
MLSLSFIPLLSLLLATAVTAAPANAGPRPALPPDLKIAVLTPVAPWSAECRGDAKKDERLSKLCPILHGIASNAGAALFGSFNNFGYRGGDQINHTIRQSDWPSCIPRSAASRHMSEECEIQVAKLHGNDHYITGKINVTDKIWSVSFELHDMHTGKLIGASEDFKARSQTKLFVAIGPLVIRMARNGLGLPMNSINKFITVKGVRKMVTERMPVPELPVDDGQVRVLFAPLPVSSALYLDGHSLCAKTPCFLRLTPGIYQARFEADRYLPATVEFEAEDEMEVKATLIPRFGWINVETMNGLHVVVDGKFVNFPLRWQEVDEGKVVSLAIAENPCYRSITEQVTIKGGERRTVKLEAKPKLAGLRVNAYDEKGKPFNSSAAPERHSMYRSARQS